LTVPRKKNPRRLASGLRRVQRQARTLLVKLRKEILEKQARLKRLRQQQASLALLSGRGGAARRVARRGAGGRRINWRAVRAQLPKRFRAADVRKVRGLSHKRSSEIFAAITRWIGAGAVKRKSRGAYEKV
jgi:hypothetical protein